MSVFFRIDNTNQPRINEDKHIYQSWNVCAKRAAQFDVLWCHSYVIISIQHMLCVSLTSAVALRCNHMHAIIYLLWPNTHFSVSRNANINGNRFYLVFHLCRCCAHSFSLDASFIHRTNTPCQTYVRTLNVALDVHIILFFIAAYVMI